MQFLQFFPTSEYDPMMRDFGTSLQDTYAKYGRDNTNFSEYSKAGKSIIAERKAQRKEYLRRAPFQQLRLAGMLGDRGLGYSYIRGGQGTSAANSLVSQQSQDLAGIDRSAMQKLNELKRAYEKEAAEREARKSKLTDYASTGIGLLSTFV